MKKPEMSWLGLALGALLILSACSGLGGHAASVTPPSSISPTAVSPAEQPSTEPTGESSRNDLKTGYLTRSLKVGDVKVAVEYSLRNRVERWSPGIEQPLTVSMTTVSQSGREPRIYLAHVTGDLDVSDASGLVDTPDPLVDKADISPGFLLTTPSSYTEVFVLPPLAEEATKLTIDFRYEILIMQPGSGTRDFAKRTTTDTLVLSIP